MRHHLLKLQCSALHFLSFAVIFYSLKRWPWGFVHSCQWWRQNVTVKFLAQFSSPKFGQKLLETLLQSYCWWLEFPDIPPQLRWSRTHRGYHPCSRLHVWGLCSFIMEMYVCLFVCLLSHNINILFVDFAQPQERKPKIESKKKVFGKVTQVKSTLT